MAILDNRIEQGRKQPRKGGQRTILRRLGDLLDRWAGRPRTSSSAGYSVRGSDWPATRLDMTAAQVESALSRIDEKDVAKAQAELASPPETPSDPSPREPETGNGSDS